MTAPHARVVRGDEATRGTPLLPPGPGPAQVRRIAREELEARLEAERVVREAHEQAEGILSQAREQGVAAAAVAEQEVRAQADADLAARWIALRQAEGRRIEDDAQRILTVAVALAERLIGATLELDPSRIEPLARGVLAEARGARRAVIHAHPVDAEVLRKYVTALNVDGRSIEIETDEALARGALRLHTDVGIIDAQLTHRLDRLADALRDALG